MQTLSLTEKAWKGASKDSPQNGGGIDQASHQGATSREHLHGVKTLLARVRRIPAQMHTTKWIFSRESTRVAVEIPITISGIDEDGHVFREATHTLDVSRRGAKISSSNLLAVGTYLWIKTSNGEKPFVARVVRHGAQNHPDDSCEICVTLPEVDGAGTIWDIQSPPEDWKTGCGQPSAAKRLERIYARDWATKFESISEAADCSTALAEDAESESTPTHTSASAAPQVSPSQFEVLPGEGLSLVVGQPQKTAQSSVSTAVRRDEVTPSTSHQAREVATSDIEERLKRVSLAMDSLEARMGALLEDFQGRMEGTLQAFQGKDAKRAEDLEKAAQELAGRWSQQLQEQAEAAVAKLREEVSSSGQVVEESKQQLANLAEAKLASLSQATRDEYSQQLEQAFQQQAQGLEKVAQELAGRWSQQLQEQAEAAVAKLREEVSSSGQVVEESEQQLASLAEARLASLSQATRDEYGQQLVQAFEERAQEIHAAAEGELKSIKQAAEEAIAQVQGKFEQQAEAALARLQEEVQESGRTVEEGKRQLAGLAEAGLASLSQAARDDYGRQLTQAFQEQAQGLEKIAQELGGRWSQQFQEQAQGLEKAAQELAGRWSQQLQEQAEAAVANLREEVSISGQVVEENKQQLASLAEAKFASLSQATRDEYSQQLEQAFQQQAQGLEKVAQELAGRWSQQLQEQAESAVAKLREEVKSSGQVVEESKQQLASLVEAKLASLSQATREEYSQQLAQAFQEQAQAIHAATDAEMKLLKQAAEEVLAQLRDAEQKKETSLATQAKAAEDRLAGVFLAVDALMEKLQGKSGNDAEDSKKIAQEFGARFSQECQKQAEAAMEKVRKEVRNSGQIVEESKRQLANLAEAKLASLNQVAAKAVSGLEAEQKRLKTKYESSQKDLEDLVARRLARLSTTSLRRAIPSKGRDIATRLGLVAVLFMIMVASLLAVSGSTHSVMQLQSEAPAQFIEQNPTWNAKRRAREEEMAQAYWRTAVLDVQERYPFGSQLPVDPPDEFQVDIKYVPTGGAKALAESRALYWEKLRATWGQREVWVESQEADTTLGARFRHIWEEIKAKFA